MIWLLACAHTPRHPAFTGGWDKRVTSHAEFVGDEYCSFEQEALWVDAQPLWALPEPEPEQNWCVASREDARWFDVVDQDGPFLSIRLTERGCCPQAETEACLTWNLAERRPATLVEYDPERAEERFAAARTALDRLGPGWIFDPQAFLVSRGHVGFCVRRGDELQLIQVN